MNSSPLINQLIESFRCLPGVGPKSAQRMTLFLLERNRAGGLKLSESLVSALNNVGNCRECRNLTEHELCSICENKSRDPSLCCVVESPADILAIEQAGTYRGVYFVLMGRLSPIDGIGPEQLRVKELLARLQENPISEVILCTNPNIEGEATAMYLARLLEPLGLSITRIASGLPVGGDLEYADELTLGRALEGRREVEVD